jgi:hypothetical protein
LRLGFAGYSKIMHNLDIIRKRLVNAINKTGGSPGALASKQLSTRDAQPSAA